MKRLILITDWGLFDYCLFLDLNSVHFRMDMVHVLGKCKRRVPIIIPPDAKLAMELLTDTRDQAGIPEDNPYFFASTGMNYKKNYPHLKRALKNAGCAEPDRITSTALRKYVATVAQVSRGIHIFY